MIEYCCYIQLANIFDPARHLHPWRAEPAQS
jgi:hypothetical protein